MNTRSCRFTFCPADTYVGKYMNWTPELARVVRGRYEQAYPEIDYGNDEISDSEKYGENYSKIIEYYKSLNEADKKELQKAITGSREISYANAYNRVNRKFTSSDINTITEIISKVTLSYNTLLSKYNNNGKLGLANLVQEARRLHPELNAYINNVNEETLASNKALANYINNRILVEAIKKNYIDLDEFFTQIYQISDTLIDEIIADEETEESVVETLRKYKSYGVPAFSTFLWMSKDLINKQSGINFGKGDKTIETFSEEQQEMFEEGVVDGWMKKVDNKNPYDKSSSNMRLFLAGIPTTVTVNGVPTPIASRTSTRLLQYNNPSTLHGMVVRATRDCATRRDMMEVLRNSPINTMNYIAEALDACEELQATCWRECNKVRQSYHDFTIKGYFTKASQIFKNLITGIYRPRDSFYSYNSRTLKTHRKGGGKSLVIRPESITSKSLIIDHENWIAFKDYVNSHVVQERGVYKFTDDPSIPLEIGIAEFIKKVANEYLGLNINKNFLNTLANEDPISMRSFMFNVYQIANSKYEGNLSKPESARDLIEGKNRSYFNRLFSLIEEISDRSTMTARDKDTDSTYAKDTMPNDLGIAINTLRSFARRMKSDYTNKEEVLREYKAHIEENYLKSSEYAQGHTEVVVEDGKEVTKVVYDKIYNDIIRSLYETTESDFNNESSFINEFIKSGERLLKVKDGYRTIAVDSMNEMQNLRSFMLEFFGSEDAIFGTLKGGYANYATFTMGDSSVIKTLRTKIYNYDQLKEQFANVAEQEVQRMILENNAKRNLRLKGNEDTVQKEEQNIDVDTICASANKNESGEVNSLVTGNFVYLRSLNAYKEELAEAYKLGTEFFRAKVKEILFEREGALLLDEFSNSFFKHIDPNQQGKYSNILKTKQIETVDAEGNKTGEVKTVFTYFPELEFSNVFNTVKEGENTKYEVDLSPDNTMYIYYLNNKLALIQQFQFFKKNPDAYNAKDKSTGEMILSSVALQKRFKAENTPGIHPDVTATWNGKLVSETGKEKVIYFKEFVKSIADTDPNMLKLMQKQWGDSDSRIKKYGKTKSTDGQGFRTFESYRAVMVMTDNWSVEKEAAFNRIQSLRKELQEIIKQYKDIKNIDELPENVERKWAKIIDEINEAASTHFQPVKPHVSSAEAINVGESNEESDILYIPVEHKYAEALIIPEQYFFLNNKILYHLGNYMENNHIDMACSEECVKVGNWGTTELMYDTDENGFYHDDEGNKVETRDKSNKKLLEITEDSVNSKLSKAIVHEINYADYEIQTEVPPHYDTAQLVGTQLRKLAFSTILKEGNYELFSKTLGNTIKEFKVGGETYSLNNADGLIKFYNAIVGTKMLNSFLELANDVTDESTFSDILSALKTKDAQGTPNDIIRYATEDGEFKVPLAEITHAYDNENYTMNLFKKRVNRQKVRGGSFVQVTDLGYDDLQTHFDEKGNVTYHDCVATWDLSVRINGRDVPLKFSDWCKADGTLKTDENGETLIEKAYPGILDRIAYRIPSERMYSILNLKVKRFVPKVNGGVICVPSYLVTAAGFDFK